MLSAMSLKKHESDQMVSWALETRAWITACSVTVVRLLLIVSNQGAWFSKEPTCQDGQLLNCIGSYNESILDSTQDIFRVLIKIIVGITAVTCVLCYKWRWLGKSFIYLEMCLHISAMFFPNSKNYHSTFYFNTYEAFANCAALYTNQPITIYMYTFTLIMANFFGTNIAYSKPLGFKEVIIYIAAVVFFFLSFSCFFTSVNIVIKLLRRLQIVNEENTKLLNNMHEGLLILRKPDQNNDRRSVMFCNKPAEKLLISLEQSTNVSKTT